MAGPHASLESAVAVRRRQPPRRGGSSISPDHSSAEFRGRRVQTNLHTMAPSNGRRNVLASRLVPNRKPSMKLNACWHVLFVLAAALMVRTVRSDECSELCTRECFKKSSGQCRTSVNGGVFCEIPLNAICQTPGAVNCDTCQNVADSATSGACTFNTLNLPNGESSPENPDPCCTGAGETPCTRTRYALDGQCVGPRYYPPF